MTSRSDPPSTWDEQVLTDVYRRHWGRLLSLLVTRTRRLDLAEEALSEAFARAAARWPDDGAPANPAGWLYTTAWRLVIGRLRSEDVAQRKAALLAVAPGWVPPPTTDHADDLDDDRLQLILLCCHPALPPMSRSALALRLVVGTPTEEIARLFLVSPSTMAARLTRARKKIVQAGIPLSAPAAEELRRRLDEVCRTIYLAFTAGYAPAHGVDVNDVGLAGDAVELAQLLHRLVPDSPQAGALAALLTLQHARRDARTDELGHLVTLADQDRARWHHDEIRLGLDLLPGIPVGTGYAEELRLQALIAAEHARAPTAQATDWTAVAQRYAELEDLTGSPVVRLNRAVAVAEVAGVHAGLALLDGLDDHLPDNHRLASVRADLHRRAGHRAQAIEWYTAALARCTNDAERSFLRRRLDQLA